MKLKGGFGIIITMVREDVEEGSDQVQALASDIGDLKYRADTLAYKLGSCLNGLLAVLYEYWDFPGSWRLEYSSKLRNGLL